MSQLPVVGVIGGGQLGRMLALEGHRLGVRVVVLDPEAGGPAAQVAHESVTAPWHDTAALGALADRCDVITYETEHLPVEALRAVAAQVEILPSPRALEIVQDRLAQKTFVQSLEIAQASFVPVSDEGELRTGIAWFGGAGILKTRRGGYDGRGQVRVQPGTDMTAAWNALQGAPAVLEDVVPFVRELSVIVARSRGGQMVTYPIAENVHRGGILHLTRAPAMVDAACAARAGEIATKIAHALDHVGVLTVELFQLADGALLVNEIAPRVHNSGHFTWGACVTSQFEQHLRAVAGLPLGDPTLQRPALMLNLLGDLWAAGEPDWRVVFDEPDAKLHLYGKREARPGRKMGHVVMFGDDPARAEALFARLQPGPRLRPGQRRQAA